MDNKEFINKYFDEPSKEWIEAQDRAFNAALAYEKNCIEKYDYVDMRQSLPQKKVKQCKILPLGTELR